MYFVFDENSHIHIRMVSPKNTISITIVRLAYTL